MKLFSLRLTTLKSKLYAIVFASFVVRVVAFFVLPNMGSTLAPDEGSYAALSLMVSENEFKLQPSYYGGLYKASRTLVLPASLLNNFGVDPINSVRMVSSLYGLLTLIILVKTLTDTFKLNPSYETYLTGKKNHVLTLVLIFAFLPSHFLWSTLALRESATEFWVVCFYSIFHKIY